MMLIEIHIDFEIENDVPTLLMNMKAVKEGYLVDYHTNKTSTEFMDRVNKIF